MRFSFDDSTFGVTKDGKVIHFPIATRPASVSRRAWYAFAGRLSEEFNASPDYMTVWRSRHS